MLERDLAKHETVADLLCYQKHQQQACVTLHCRVHTIGLSQGPKDESHAGLAQSREISLVLSELSCHDRKWMMTARDLHS
jgi:hypothetical protein